MKSAGPSSSMTFRPSSNSVSRCCAPSAVVSLVEVSVMMSIDRASERERERERERDERN